MKNFFTIKNLSQDSDQLYVFDVELNAEHRIFEGHFPQMPVVPGVCTLAIIKECVSEAVGRKVDYVQMRDCKFIETILPSNDLVLTIRLRIETQCQEVDTYKITGEVYSDQRTMVKIKAMLA